MWLALRRLARRSQPESSTLSTTRRAPAVISALASEVRSRVPNRSRWAGPIEVIDCDLGPEPAAERGDLTWAVGAHLGHEDLGARREVLVDGPGEAGAVVEAAGLATTLRSAPRRWAM